MGLWIENYYICIICVYNIYYVYKYSLLIYSPHLQHMLFLRPQCLNNFVTCKAKRISLNISLTTDTVTQPLVRTNNRIKVYYPWCILCSFHRNHKMQHVSRFTWTSNEVLLLQNYYKRSSLYMQANITNLSLTVGVHLALPVCFEPVSHGGLSRNVRSTFDRLCVTVYPLYSRHICINFLTVFH